MTTVDIVYCGLCKWMGFEDCLPICVHAKGLVGTVAPTDYCSHGEPSGAAEKAERDQRLADAGFEV